jgi:hypothetical protein
MMGGLLCLYAQWLTFMVMGAMWHQPRLEKRMRDFPILCYWLIFKDVYSSMNIFRIIHVVSVCSVSAVNFHDPLSRAATAQGQVLNSNPPVFTPNDDYGQRPGHVAIGRLSSASSSTF